MRIKILKPELTILGAVRKVGDIVNDPDPNESRNLVADGRAEYLSPEEDLAEQEKEDLAAAQAAEEADKLRVEKAENAQPQQPA